MAASSASNIWDIGALRQGLSRPWITKKRGAGARVASRCKEQSRALPPKLPLALSSTRWNP
eukprot:scaffold3820_cov415-Prasinococcus_capsulatus_cf.AAC.3